MRLRALRADGEAGAAGRALALHGALDLAFAALYGWLGFVVVPGQSLTFDCVLGAVIALLVVAGVALLARRRWARALALVASGLLLAFAVVVIALLVASAGYLRGIYGALGQGMALVTLLVAALVVELCGLLPLFQIRMLLRADVRRLLSAPAAPPTRGD